MTIKTTRLEPGRHLGTSNLSWGGTMFRTGRFSAPGLAVILVAALAAAGCSSQAGPAPTTENVASASAAPSVLTSAALLIDGDAPRLLLAADGPLRPMVYAREGSKTLVVDLPGTVVTPGLEPPRADGTLLTALEMRSFSELGQPQVRFELTGRGALDAQIAGDPASRAMSVALMPRIEEPVLAQSGTAASAEAIAAIEASPQAAAPVVSAAPAAASTEPVVVARHEASGTAATRLAHVATQTRDGALSVRLEGDGELSYEAFTLPSPPRFVVDLSGVRNASRFRNEDVDAAGVARVRVSQFRTEPTAVTRVVFDLEKETVPVLRQSGSTVSISFGGEAAAPIQVASAAPAAGSYEAHEADDASEPTVPPAAAPEPVVPVSEAPEVRVAEANPALEAPVAESPADPAPVVATALPAPEPVSVRTPEPIRVAAAPAPTVTVASPEVAVPAHVAPRPAHRKTSADDRALLEAAETLASDQKSGGQLKDISNPYESRALGQLERQYTGEPLSLNLKDADIKDTLQKFSELTNLNIVLDPDVRGTVTVSLTDIPWDQALELILKINGLGYVLEGNVMRIAATGKLASEEAARQSLLKAQESNRPTRTVIQKLSYASAGTAAGTAKKVMSPRGDIFVDERSNLLIIKELPEYLPTVLDLVKSLDTPVPQVMIEARIVEATRTFSKRLGIDWGFLGVSDQAHGNTTGMVFPNSAEVEGAVSLPNGNQILRASLANVLDTFRLDVALSAAEARGLVKIVSSPKILTQTNVAASVQSGFQIPVQTTVNNTTTVLYIDATLRLDVTPQVTAEGTVILDIKIQRREPAPGVAITGGNNVPLVTRDAQTRLMVRDGGTGMIAGIFKLSANDGQNMIPGLWKIPLLGGLFRNKTMDETTDELMIFITPRVMKAL